MAFEFEDAVIVVEVPLTASSRQEAAEGESVRRHVAQYAEVSNKTVYGLFIAVQVDSNTAHTFRSGDWYLPDDCKLSLDIVPLTLGILEPSGLWTRPSCRHARAIAPTHDRVQSQGQSGCAAMEAVD